MGADSDLLAGPLAPQAAAPLLAKIAAGDKVPDVRRAAEERLAQLRGNAK